MKRLVAALPLALLVGCALSLGIPYDQLDLDRALPNPAGRTAYAAAADFRPAPLQLAVSGVTP